MRTDVIFPGFGLAPAGHLRMPEHGFAAVAKVTSFFGEYPTRPPAEGRAA
ncbi:hypothetical protein [Streptomyces milbemycinicus]|uniref:Uncharacterized protein n=1 Tax=Streptomyces milbemycinicus TaxID=476552 RepID=A0ABW8LRY8_9ACTN